MKMNCNIRSFKCKKKWWQGTYQHEGWGKEAPADVPVHAHSVPDHVLDAKVELLSPEHPADSDGLEEYAPQ